MSSFERGTVCAPSQVFEFIQHVMQFNLQSVKSGGDRLVGCIWGVAGISKTSVIKQLETRGVLLDGEVVKPKVVHIALAQIEESGDLTGLPEVRVNKETGEHYTDYAPPKWWPTSEEPTVLLFDDFNRADPRILKAIMQILQDYRSNVCDLPKNTHIMLTGNPSGDDYMVNEIDKAILTRMLHITMKFDKIDWAKWATEVGVDKRVINFALRYPELCDGTHGTRTNPRSVVQFANLISPISDLKSSPLLSVLSRSCLDDDVATAFEKFVVGGLQELVDPEDILNNYDTAIKKVETLAKGRGGKPRTDLIGIIVDRFFVYLMQDGVTKLSDKQKDAFVSFIKRTDILPQDLMYTLLRRLRKEGMATEAKNKFILDLVTYGGDELADLIMQIV